MKKKIFIAGASGMVGSAIYRKLLERFPDKQKDGSILIPDRVELNLIDQKKVDNWFVKNKPSIVILAAAKVGGIFANSSMPADFILDNLLIQTNVIKSAWKNDVNKFIFLGSSCIYPKFSEQPIREESLLSGILEKTNENYAIAKIAGLKLCEALKNQYGFNTISLMPTNLYGPGDNYHRENSHVLPALIIKFYDAMRNKNKIVNCWGSGNPLREFLYVDDLADACIFTLENLLSGNLSHKNINLNDQNWLNIGSDFEISIKELSYLIAKEFDFKGDINWDPTKPDGTPRKKLDNSIINSLGWNAKTNLEVGIRKTIKDFKKCISNNNLRI